MAVGLARMFSLQFPINFNSPFKAQNIAEFWQRWHMTLSRYLNEYLYTPFLELVTNYRLARNLSISRKAVSTPAGFLQMVLFPTMTTMFLAGIWHGAGLQFVAFGVLHGFYLSVNNLWRVLTPKNHRLHRRVPAWMMILLTFLCVHVAEVFFRAASLHDALYVLATMTGFHSRIPFAAFPFLNEIPSNSRFLNDATSTTFVIAVCFFIVWAFPNTEEILGQSDESVAAKKYLPSLFPHIRWKPSLRWSLGITALFCVVILLLDASTRFLYFQF
jgi:D-alanyl-lipoteichoic acid acyltransferase DltB (MBOAT superfamily)